MSKWGLGAVSLFALVACREAPNAPPSAPREAAGGSATVTTTTSATAPSASPSPTPPGTEKAAPADPERLCVETDGTVTVEHDCGCNDALLCVATQGAPGAVSVAVRKDPSRMPMCSDCFPMVPGKCPLPGSASGPTVIRAGTLELHVELKDGKPASRVCAATRK